MTSSPKVWGDALRRLQDEIPEFVFDAWIAPLAVKISEDRLSLGSPTSFHRDRIRRHHLEAIERAWRSAWEGSEASHASAAQSDGRIVPPIDLLTRAELAEAPGLAVDCAAALRAACGAAIGPAAAAPDQQKHPVAMRKVEVAVARAQAVGGSAVPSQRGPTARGPGSAEIADPSVRSDSPGALDVSELAALPAAERAVDPSGRAAVNQAQSRAALPSASDFAGADSGRNDRPTRNEGRRLSVVPGSAGRKGAEPVRNDARNALERSQAQARSQHGLDLELDGEGHRKPDPFSFDSFILGPCNSLAREAALALARRRQQSLNQLYLAGGAGMGKTHLARATAEEARRHALAEAAARARSGRPPQGPAARLGPSGPSSARRAHGTSAGPAAGPGQTGILYTSAEQFTSEFVSAMRNGRNEAWTRRYRGAIQLLVVEDIQFLVGRTKTQLELYHTIEHVLDSGGRVLLTGDRPPRDLHSLDDRMQKLVARGFVAELDRPDAIVRRHILRAKAAAGGVHLPADCLDLLVDSTGGSIRDIEGVLIQVVTTASLLGRPIDLALTRDAIDLKSGASSKLGPSKLEVGEIVRVVAAFFGMRPEALASRSRRRDVLIPRQLSMYLANRYTEASLTEIGRALGRDHPSVRNAIQRIERQVLEKAPIRYQVEALCERLEAHLEDTDR